ncbi:hypothetical protein [Brevibacillus laterosporus]|uniref:hypothetical protein n=1 Tax=Brevibacillus laterosporus TaxID=1465 RepID=UPI0026515D1D|nr:hypothetical protein [Brevibacillus laterosporus]MDN9012874.1 hypothetical protein [Brevibacillus laterosporus]MDO0943988.1 hypothetical protein [Brevibacillus laterosporus]
MSSKEAFYDDGKESPYIRYIFFIILSWITFQKIEVIEKYKKHFNEQIEARRFIR